jgi:hypothetical protein
MRRHDSIRDSLARTLELGLFNDVRAPTVKPCVPNPQTGADLRRDGIKVHLGGPTWVPDVGVVCPGTQRYVDLRSQARPVATSTGGPISSLTPHRYRGPTGPAPPLTPGALQGPQDVVALRGVMQALVRIQAYMVADIVVAIRAADLAVEAVV